MSSSVVCNLFANHRQNSLGKTFRDGDSIQGVFCSGSVAISE